MRQITNELVAEFENDLRCRNPGRYKMAGKVLEDELEMGISFDTKVLEQLTDKLFALRDLIPEQGRIALYGQSFRQHIVGCDLLFFQFQSYFVQDIPHHGGEVYRFCFSTPFDLSISSCGNGSKAFLS